LDVVESKFLSLSTSCFLIKEEKKTKVKKRERWKHRERERREK
jgi:hypothetical protein